MIAHTHTHTHTLEKWRHKTAREGKYTLAFDDG